MRAAIDLERGRVRAGRRRGAQGVPLGGHHGDGGTIRQDREIRFIYAYGADTAVAPLPAAETDTATGTRSYRARTGAYDLRVLIEPARCTDAMSGQPYETTVTVTLEGKAYHGCGGPLP